jgi:hypothetical protein
MRVETRLTVYILCLTLVALMVGCGGGGDGGTNPAPVNHAPTITLLTHPADTIGVGDTASFTWLGQDVDGNLKGYYAGLDGIYSWTTSTDTSYTGLAVGTSHVFKVFAKDSANTFSDTSAWAFHVYNAIADVQLYGAGIGITDADQDGFYRVFHVKWAPINNTQSAISMRLVVAVKPTYGAMVEVKDSTALINRIPGATDSLTYELNPFTKNYYDISLEVHGEDGSLLASIPYGAVPSLTSRGLEDVEGFHAWFEDAWTANAVDTLPQGNPDGFYESIDLWWNVDAYPDAGNVKIVVYERNSAGDERYLTQSILYEVSGFGINDAVGTHIIAGTTFDQYDYRLALLDQGNVQIGEIAYGDDPDLMDIPLGNSSGLNQLPIISELTK